MSDDGMKRCPWAEGSDLMCTYHDEEWGVPVRDDRALFEFLILEGAQAGLSWATILRKREAYRRAFFGFDIERVAQMPSRSLEKLLAPPVGKAAPEDSIVRNRAKVFSVVANAKVAIDIRREFGSLSAHLWGFVGGAPQANTLRAMADVPAKTTASETMSKDLKKRGMNFVGPTICYAFMQATGMVNDHLVGCFRHGAINPG